MKILDLLSRGGFMIWPILVCVIVVATVATGRFLALRKASLGINQFALKFKLVFLRSNAQGALALCTQKGTPLANIMYRATTVFGAGILNMREVGTDALREEVRALRGNVGLLLAVAGVAPGLGLLGIALEMIGGSFTSEMQAGIHTIVDLGSGRGSALVTTASGLIVGIPALMLYLYFSSRFGKLVRRIESISTELIDFLEGEKRKLTTEVENSVPAQVGILIEDDDPFFRRKRVT